MMFWPAPFGMRDADWESNNGRLRSNVLYTPRMRLFVPCFVSSERQAIEHATRV